jgi:competence protein ComEC
MPDKDIVFRFLNVGQGDSTHIILPDGQHMLVDMNLDHKNHGIDVVAYLADELPKGDEKKRLAYLVNTHPHDDHIRGMGGLGNTFEIGEMWHSGHERDCEEGENDSYDKFMALIDNLGDQAKAVCACSDPWATIDDVKFHVFRPSAYVKPDKDKTEDEKREAIHNECMVLKVSYADRSVLLVGDSNKAAWESIVKHYDEDDLLKADVLHASHHGSRTFFKKKKEDDAWTVHLDNIDPDVVIISVGADNPHEHPHSDALKLYEDADCEICRTDENLTIVLTISADGTMNWTTDDQDFQDKYQLPDPDYDSDSGGGKQESASESWGTPLISKTKLGDRSPTA